MSSQTMSRCNITPLYFPDNLIPILFMANTLVLVLLLWKWGLFKRNEIARLPPGPDTLPVVGNMHQIIWNKPVVFRWIHRLLNEMGTDILCLRLRATHVVVVACPEMAREILRRKDDLFTSRPATIASKLFSYGYKAAILTTHEYQWKKMKRLVTSEILSPSMERRLYGHRVGEADHLIRYVHNQAKMIPDCCIDVRHVTQHFCGNIIRRLIFGKRYFHESPVRSNEGPGPDEVQHVNALFTLLNYVYSFCISDYFPALVGLDLDGHEKVAKRVMSTLDRLHNPIIEERIKEWSNRRKVSDTRDVADFLDVLLSLDDAKGEPLLSLEEIKAQVVEIMFATVDNPSNAVEWALAEMINKPDAMQKAVNELDAVVGKERLVEESDLSKLNYLKSCIREAFRIHPYHAFTPPRVAKEDTTVSGYFIPKGSQVILSRAGLGRNPKVWLDPLKFRPEHDDMVLLTEPDLRFISFGTGRRGCPGVSLGTSVTMILFARLLQGFTWTKPPNIDTINLQESYASLLRAAPLVLQAKPRLAEHFYDVAN